MVFFDLDGTLLDHRGAEREAAMAFLREHAGVFSEPAEEFVERWRTVAEKHLRRYIMGEATFQEQRRDRMRETFGFRWTLSDVEADDLYAACYKHYEHNWRPYPDVAGCIDDFTGERLGVISNGEPQQQRRKLAALGLLERFTLIVISGDVGAAKPERGIFLAACKAGAEDPGNCFFVGDDLEADTKGCRRAGMNGIWLNRHGLPNPAGIPTIASLRDLRRTIDVWKA
jgi:putative hydrolase of the HAD superfamily